MSAQDLRDRQRVLEEELAETKRLLSASQLAYHLNIIHGLLKDGEAEKALAEFEGLTLKELMVLHGHTETYRRIGKTTKTRE